MSMAKQIIDTVKQEQISILELMANLRHEVIAFQLQQNGYNITATAESLCMKRGTLQEILRRQGLTKLTAALKYEKERS